MALSVRTLPLPLLLLFSCPVVGQKPPYDSIVFRFKKFINDVNRSFTTVNHQTDVFNCEFIENADFSVTTFLDTVKCQLTSFHKLTDFSSSTFERSTDFSTVNFIGKPMFDFTVWKGECDFTDDSILDGCFFSNCRFSKKAEFTGCCFKGSSSFDGVVFCKDISFGASDFFDRTYFNSAVFLGNLDLRNIKIYGDRIDLTTARTDTGRGASEHKCGIMLSGADIQKIKLDYSHFYLLFDPHATYEDRSNVYQSVLNNFKNDGFTESYELLDKEYRTFQYKHKGQWFLLWLDRYWWDFGYAKYYIFYWILGFLAAFTFVNLFLYPFLHREVYAIKNVKADYPWWNIRQFPTRCYYALIYTAVLFFSLSVKLENVQYRRWYAILYIFLIYALGIICLGYTANFILQK